MPIAAFKRREIKYLLTRKQQQALMPILLKHMAADTYCRNGRHYSVYNVYYDTPDFHLIRTSLDKPRYKEKLRLRSYASPAMPDSNVFLELKRKTAGIVHKRRAIMTLQEAYAFLDAGEQPGSAAYMDRQVISELSYFLSVYPVQPAFFIGYHRMAFFGKDDRAFRITFDTDIRTRSTDVSLEEGAHGDRLLPEDTILMEVKITSAVPLWFSEALARLWIYSTSFSKYGMAYKKEMYGQSTHPIHVPGIALPLPQSFIHEPILKEAFLC